MPLADVGRVAAGGWARLQERRSGSRTRPSRARRSRGRVLAGRLVLGLGREQRWRLGGEGAGCDDVRVRLHAVERRRRVGAGVSNRAEGSSGVSSSLESPHSRLSSDRRAAGARPADSVTRAPEQRTGRGARHEQDAGEHERDADDQRARFTEDAREPAAECGAERASVIRAEARRAARRGRRRGPCGTAAGRRARCGRASARRSRAGRAGRVARPRRAPSSSQSERRAPTGPPSQPSQTTVASRSPTASRPSAPELGMVMPAGLLRALADTRRAARLPRPRGGRALLASRHGLSGFCAPRASPAQSPASDFESDTWRGLSSL